MKIQVMHDKAGRIQCIFAPVKGKRRGFISSPDSKMSVIEMDAPKSLSILNNDANEDNAAALRSLMEDYVVKAGKLTKRSTKK